MNRIIYNGKVRPRGYGTKYIFLCVCISFFFFLHTHFNDEHTNRIILWTDKLISGGNKRIINSNKPIVQAYGALMMLYVFQFVPLLKVSCWLMYFPVCCFACFYFFLSFAVSCGCCCTSKAKKTQARTFPSLFGCRSTGD